MRGFARGMLVLLFGLLAYSPGALSTGPGGGFGGGDSATQALTVKRIRAISRERLPYGLVEVTYRVKVKNKGAPLTNVVLKVFPKNPHVQIIDGEVVLGELGTGVVTSSDTFTIRKKRRTRTRKGDFKFKFFSDKPTANEPPVADAGSDQAVDTGSSITLDGSASSDADGDALSFSWSLQLPANSTAVLSDPTVVNPSFVVDVEGAYVATLIVNDGTEKLDGRRCNRERNGHIC